MQKHIFLLSYRHFFNVLAQVKMEKLHEKKMLKHMLMGGSSFFMEKSLHPTLTSFMNKLNDLFSP
jgi:hypothetical protein